MQRPQPDEFACKNHFEVLDGLRGVAAFVVLIAHATSIVLGPTETLIPRNYLAVYFFFMLSGFVIGYAYETKIRNGMSLRVFFMRRIVRLYPLIVAAVVVAALTLTAGNPHFRGDPMALPAVVLGALGLPSPSTSFSFGSFPLNPPQWSLFYELIAYVVFAVLIAKASMLRLGLLLLSFTVAYGSSFLPAVAAMPFPWVVFHALAPFSLGVLLWRLSRANAFPRFTVNFFPLAVALVVCCWIPLSAGTMLDFLIVIMVFPLFIIFGTGAVTGKMKKINTFLGELSYPLYILHWTVLKICNTLLYRAVGPVLTILAAVTAATLFSWAFLVVYDRPIRRMLGTKLLPQPAAAAPLDLRPVE